MFKMRLTYNSFLAFICIAALSSLPSTSASITSYCQRKDNPGDGNKEAFYDYIVAGSGAGGGVVASRLAQAGFKTLLLDAGPDYDSPLVDVPVLWPFATITPEIEWAIRVSNSDAPGRDDVLYPKASMIGGCSTHNAMQFVYSYPGFWDKLKALTGDAEFDEAAMRKRFEKLENNQYAPEGTPGHGFDGYIGTTFADPALLTEFQDLALTYIVGLILFLYSAPEDVAQSASFPIIPDINSPGGNTVEGAHFTPLSISREDGYKRASVRDLIRQVQSETENLIVKPLSFVTKILTHKGPDDSKPTAYGVVVREGSGLYEASTGPQLLEGKKRYYARKEVIVSGGAFNTPQMLMLSGIGPAEHLQQNDIEVVADVPGIGQNLRDKLEAVVNYEAAETWTLFEQGCTFLQPSPLEDPCFLGYLRGEFPNLYTTNGGVIAFQTKSDSTLSAPDMYTLMAAFRFDGFGDNWVQTTFNPAGPPGLAFNVITSTSVDNVGNVTLKSDDPFQQVSIDFNGYADEDVTRVANEVQKIRDNIGQNLLDEKILTKETAPGPEAQTIEEVKEWVKKVGWGHHACCTAKMSDTSDPMGVVNGQLQLHAVNNLRVVDLSVFPEEPAFFPIASIYMMAEKAAEDIIAASLDVGICA